MNCPYRQAKGIIFVYQLGLTYFSIHGNAATRRLVQP